MEGVGVLGCKFERGGEGEKREIVKIKKEERSKQDDIQKGGKH